MDANKHGGTVFQHEFWECVTPRRSLSDSPRGHRCLIMQNGRVPDTTETILETGTAATMFLPTLKKMLVTQLRTFL